MKILELNTYEELSEFLKNEKNLLVEPVESDYATIFRYNFPELDLAAIHNETQKCINFLKLSLEHSTEIGQHALHRISGPACFVKGRKKVEYFVDGIAYSFAKWKKHPQVIAYFEKINLKEKIKNLEEK